MIFYIYFVMTPNLLTKPKMENDGSFLENWTATSLKKRCLTTMEVSTKFVETIPWESSRKKSQHSTIPAKKVYTHAYSDDELGKK